MLCWAIDACKKSKYNIDVMVSSDSEEILDIANKWGAMPYRRSPELAQDNVFKQEVIRDAVSFLKNRGDCYDVVISLQPNSPQIKSQYLDSGIDFMLERNLSEVFSVNSDMVQNSAFRIMKWDYVFQRDLSTYCGVVVCDMTDIHVKDDMDKITNI